MAVGVLELGTHANNLIDLCQVLEGLADVTVFTTRELHDRVETAVVGEVTWVLQEPDESRRAFLSRIERRTPSLDVLLSLPLYGTVVDYLDYARFAPDCPFVLSAYDLNGWTATDPALTRRPYNYAKYPLKRWLLRRVDVLLVEFDSIETHVEHRFEQVPVDAFTPVVGDDEQGGRGGGDGDVVLTVPGMIDRSRREYGVVLEALEALEALDEEGTSDVELVLLGEPVGEYGDAVVDRARNIGGEDVTVTTFESWIGVDTYARELGRSDVLVSPLRRHRTVDGFVETYGRTKGSGAISDAIRHATPLLLPSWYEVPAAVSAGVETFDGPGSLARTLATFVEGEADGESLFAGAREMAANFGVAEQQTRLEAVLRRALSR